MPTEDFVVSHAQDACFERGLRAYFEYHSEDIEMLEIVMPADFTTEAVETVNR